MTRPPPPSDRVRRAYLRVRLFVLVIGIPQAAIGVYLLTGGISHDETVITAAGAVLVLVATLFVAVTWLAVTGLAASVRRHTVVIGRRSDDRQVVRRDGPQTAAQLCALPVGGQSRR